MCTHVLSWLHAEGRDSDVSACKDESGESSKADGSESSTGGIPDGSSSEEPGSGDESDGELDVDAKAWCGVYVVGSCPLSYVRT